MEIDLDDLSDEAWRKLASHLVDELEARGLVTKGDDLVTLEKYAGEKDVARSTIYRRMKRHDIPRRRWHGGVKESDGGTAYVSRTEMEMGKKLDTRVVRRADGQYD